MAMLLLAFWTYVKELANWFESNHYHRLVAMLFLERSGIWKGLLQSDDWSRELAILPSAGYVRLQVELLCSEVLDQSVPLTRVTYFYASVWGFLLKRYRKQDFGCGLCVDGHLDVVTRAPETFGLEKLPSPIHPISAFFGMMLTLY